MSAFDTPDPPNPIDVARASTSTNVSTAVANAFLNNVNQVTPQGTLNYDQTGTFNWTDPTTNTAYAIPRFTATQVLSPAQQAISGQSNLAQYNLANMAANQSASVGNLLSTYFNPTQGSAGSPTRQSTFFDPQAYLAAYPDVAAFAKANNLDPAGFAQQHYQSYGQGEGRTAGFATIPGVPATAPAPGMGEMAWLHSVPFAQSGFADVGGQQRGLGPYANQQINFDNVGGPQFGFGGAGDITRSYGPGDFSADRSKVEESLYKRMDPQLQRDRQALEARLADQGIQVGSMAHQQAMDQFNRQLTDTRLGITQTAGQEQQRMMDMAAQRAGFENAAQMQEYQQQQGRGQFFNTAQQQAWQQALGRGQFANQAQMEQFQKQLQSGTFANQAQQQAFQQEALRGQFANSAAAQNMARNQAIFNAQNEQRTRYLAEQYQQRNQPINEITALLSGSQVAGPSFINTPSNQIATTDIAGLINNRFSQDMDAYKQQSANFNSLMGGIFGALGGLAKSDRREKEDIDKVGSIFAAGPDGQKPLPIYEYSFKDDPASTRHVGPMAQDVEKVDRKAVKTIKGVKYIDKTKLGSILKVA